MPIWRNAVSLTCLLMSLSTKVATSQITRPRNTLRFDDSRNFCIRGTQRPNVCITLPTTTTRDEIDIFFLLDGTDTYLDNIEGLAAAIQSTITTLAEQNPTADIAYGVGQFEDFGGPVASQFSNQGNSRAKPFTLVQPIVRFGNTTRLIQFIQTALASDNGISPGAADDPHTAIEALYEVASGLGFDGNNDNTTLGNRASEQFAGRRSVRENPDTSGDIPPFSTLGGRRSSGSIGGAGFRENALKIVVLGTDICTVAPFDTVVPLRVESATYETDVSSLAFACAGRDRFGLLGEVAPNSTTTSGAHSVDATIQLLNDQGIRVIGMFVDNVAGAPVNPSITKGADDERVFMEALSVLTGTVDEQDQAYMVAYDPTPGTLSANLVSALSNVFRIAAPSIELRSDDCDGFQNGLVDVTFPDPVEGVSVGQQVCFRPTFALGNGATAPQEVLGTCTLNFRDSVLNLDYGDIEVSFQCGNSEQPSESPSDIPSASPSSSPSVLPTASPSAHPSDAPSVKPSTTPSATPSVSPSARPSTSPSAHPSAKPSSQPSGAPSASPSVAPSSKPSGSPSASPSVLPTNSPSSKPSSKPSVHPSGTPSVSPSAAPSLKPSTSPSLHPSASPSSRPSGKPSSKPSGQPTSTPSARPSAAPSAQPSTKPSTVPSASPSLNPTSSPSGQPSAKPSSQPSAKPSRAPSVSPSAKPSAKPSEQPSARPSSQPSAKPSSAPSVAPSANPSTRPSTMPSNTPSAAPSARPSAKPSSKPTTSPSATPSVQPSMSPSNHPSSGPSNQPSAKPSGTPSVHPSAMPSMSPSNHPSSRPSNQPSAKPSGTPSVHPSVMPSMSPSNHPSSRPSNQPSAKPSNTPSVHPSAMPSMSPSLSANLAGSEQPSAGPTVFTNLIISEIVDGRVDTNRPNYVELTNCGSASVDLSEYSLGIFSNTATEVRSTLRRNRAVVLSGMLAPGESFVVRYTDNDAAMIFVTTYPSVTPDLTVTHRINGDDVVALYLGAATGNGSDATLVDIFGEVGVNPRGTVADWRVGFAVRNRGARSTNTWDATQWVVSRRALRGVGNTEPEIQQNAIDRHRALTDPGQHVCGV